MISIDTIRTLAKTLSLSTDRLTLRLFKSTDLDEEMKQQQDPEVIRYIREPLSNEEALLHFQQFIQPWAGEEDEWLGFCLVRSSDQHTVGALSFKFQSLENEVVEIGYRLARNYHGQGYAFEAVSALVDFIFAELKVHKVVAHCDPRNSSSFKLMEKLGMQREAHLRQHSKLGQQWNDEFIYGLLDHEWVANKKIAQTSAKR